jgi:glutaredoxin
MSAIRVAALAAIAAGAALSAGLAHAQVYRIVGPDGKVTFSDRPPPDAKATPAQTVPMGGSGGTPTASLPLELRNAVNRYPVTLYTAANCGPCDAGRNYLRQRGIPYTENTVSTRDDAAALKRLSGSDSLPLLTIGSQQVPGFAEGEWSQYFDAAGYPRTSQLPSGYRFGDPRPLVAVQQAAPATQQRPAAAQPQRADATPPAERPNPDNPAGIRF